MASTDELVSFFQSVPDTTQIDTSTSVGGFLPGYLRPGESLIGKSLLPFSPEDRDIISNNYYAKFQVKSFHCDLCRTAMPNISESNRFVSASHPIPQTLVIPATPSLPIVSKNKYNFTLSVKSSHYIKQHCLLTSDAHIPSHSMFFRKQTFYALMDITTQLYKAAPNSTLFFNGNLGSLPTHFHFQVSPTVRPWACRLLETLINNLPQSDECHIIPVNTMYTRSIGLSASKNVDSRRKMFRILRNCINYCLRHNLPIVMQWFGQSRSTLAGEQSSRAKGTGASVSRDLRVSIVLSVYKSNVNPKIMGKTRHGRLILGVPSLSSLDLYNDTFFDSILDPTTEMNSNLSYYHRCSKDVDYFLHLCDKGITKLHSTTVDGKPIWETTFITTDAALTHNTINFKLVEKNVVDSARDPQRLSVEYGYWTTLMFILDPKSLTTTFLKKDIALWVSKFIKLPVKWDCISLRGPFVKSIYPYIVEVFKPVDPEPTIVYNINSNLTVKFDLKEIQQQSVYDTFYQIVQYINNLEQPSFNLIYGLFDFEGKFYLSVEHNDVTLTPDLRKHEDLASLLFGVKVLAHGFGVDAKVPFRLLAEVVDLSGCGDDAFVLEASAQNCFNPSRFTRLTLIPQSKLTTLATLYVQILGEWIQKYSPQDGAVIVKNNIYKTYVEPYIVTKSKSQFFLEDDLVFKSVIFSTFINTTTCKADIAVNLSDSGAMINPPDFTAEMNDFKERSVQTKREEWISLLYPVIDTGNDQAVETNLEAYWELRQMFLLECEGVKFDFSSIFEDDAMDVDDDGGSKVTTVTQPERVMYSPSDVAKKQNDFNEMFCLWQGLLSAVSESQIDDAKLSLSFELPPILNVMFNGYVNVIKTLNYDSKSHSLSSAYGVTASLGWKGSNTPFSIVKVNYSPTVPLLHEVVVGFACNTLNSDNFMKVYGGAMCSKPAKEAWMTSTKPFVPELCSSSYLNEMMMFAEYIQAESSFADMLETMSAAEEEILKVLAQLIFSIYDASVKLGFIHNDLHFENVLIRKSLNKKKQFVLPNGKTVEFASEYEPVIIDYGLSSIVWNGQLVLPIRTNVKLDTDMRLDGYPNYCVGGGMAVGIDPQLCYMRQYNLITKRLDERLMGYDLFYFMDRLQDDLNAIMLVPDDWIQTYKKAIGWKTLTRPDTIRIFSRQVFAATTKNITASQIPLSDKRFTPFFD